MTISTVADPQSLDETLAWGREFASSLEPGDVVALHGDLGAGKTSLVQGIARGLSISAPVTSPTFTLIHEHRDGRMPLFHIDLYRLPAASAAVAIGIEDYLPSEEGVTVIEWAERVATLLPPDTRHLTITVTGETSRHIELAPLPC